MHRPFAFALVLLAACGGKKSQEAPAAARFAPSDADTVVRLDLARARAWTGWAKAAPLAFRAVQPAIDAVKSACGIDLFGEAGSLLLARRGVGSTSDMTLAIGGLPKDKTSGCAAKLGAAIPGVSLVPDGDRFQVNRGGKGFASGAILASGEVVIVSRGGTAVEPGAWRTEVTGGSGAAPAWWSELDQTQPLAVRMSTPEHTIAADAELADPFVIRAKVTTASPQSAQVDLARMKAILEFLQKAGAGNGRLEPRDNVVHADFTATGKEIDSLVAAALSAIGADQAADEPPPAGNTAPIACTELTAAVSTYLKASLEHMAPDQRGLIEPTIAKLEKNLANAYVESCATGAWAPEVIHCHVDNATTIARFEKCRMLVPDDARKKFDERVKAALQASAVQ